MCQKYGKVEHIKIYYDPLTKKHAGKARVTFDLTKSAKLACTKLNSCSVMGNIITTQLEPNLKGLYLRKYHGDEKIDLSCDNRGIACSRITDVKCKHKSN